jgi:hypothetical protein
MSQPTLALVSSLAHPLAQPMSRTARLGRAAAGVVVRPARTAVRWPVESQQRSRRNAMLAATDLTDRRRQTLLVEDYLADYTAAWESRHETHHPVLAAQG